MSRSDSDPESSSASELEALFRRLRDERPAADVDRVAAALPARVAARLRGEGAVEGVYLRWAMGLAPLTAACVVSALLRLDQFGVSALTDPQAAGWLVLFLG